MTHKSSKNLHSKYNLPGPIQEFMVERMLRKLMRGKVQRPAPAVDSVSNNHPIPHTSKKPMLAVTGTKPDKICAICLGRLEPGNALTFCNCGKYFHMTCVSELGECPICGFALRQKPHIMEKIPDTDDLMNVDAPDEDIIEIVYQCPICDSYVPEDSERCS